MPQVTINEIDQSRYLSVASRAPLIALTPVISSFGPADDAVLIENESQYDSIFGPKLPVPVLDDMTRNYAITLLNSGVTLLAKRITPIVVTEKTVDGVTTAEVDPTYVVSDITANTVYTKEKNSLADVAFTAKNFGTRGNDIAFQFNKVTLNSGPIEIEEEKIVYRINTYLVNSHKVKVDDTTGLYIGTFNGSTNSMSDYVGVDSVTISTIPSDSNYIGNTTYLSSQLTDMNIDITFKSDVLPTKENYKALLEALCNLTDDNQAILLVGGDDYFKKGPMSVTDEAYDTSSSKTANGDIVPGSFTATVTVPTEVTDETCTVPTTLGQRLAHYPVAETGITGSIVTDDAEPVTYAITASEAVEGVVTLSSATLAEFSGSITLANGSISLVGVPAGATVTFNYTYTTDYTITEGEPTSTEGVVNLVCEDLVGFTGTLKYSDGTLVLNNVPVGATLVMNYTYIGDFQAQDIKAQFLNALSFRYDAKQYPKTLNKFFEAFSDHYVYDFDVIVGSGFTGLDDIYTDQTSTSNLHLNMLRLAIGRGDAVALLDTPQYWGYEDVYEYTDKTGGYQPQYSFGAVHAPWCKMRDLSTGNYAMMPASLAFLGAVANGLVINGESSLWYAPAGVARASCPNVISAQYEIGGTILNYWQNTQVARVNPIMKILSNGYCVYGNATLMQNMKGYTKSSLQSLGTRFLCNSIKKAIFSICVRLTFEPNDYNLWSTFRTELGEVLRQYQLNGVISQYEIIMDDSTVTDEDKQNLTVPGKVNIVPTLPAEYFDIDFTISAQGVTFAEQVIE